MRRKVVKIREAELTRWKVNEKGRIVQKEKNKNAYYLHENQVQ